MFVSEFKPNRTEKNSLLALFWFVVGLLFFFEFIVYQGIILKNFIFLIIIVTNLVKSPFITSPILPNEETNLKIPSL